MANIKQRRLSEQQRQIFRMLAQGSQYREIADFLRIGVNTVGEAARSARDKLEVLTMLGAVVKAIKLGEIRLEEIDV